MIEKLPFELQRMPVIQDKVNELVDAVNELQHDNSEKANCQGSVLTMVDNQVTANLPNIDAGELAFLSKENSELKDEIDRLKTDLERTRKALDRAKNGLKELKDIIACPPDVSYETGVSMYADGVLQEITALEQKDVK